MHMNERNLGHPVSAAVGVTHRNVSSWSTREDRFNAWFKVERFQGLMKALIAEAAARWPAGMELVGVDSMIVRARGRRSTCAAEIIS